MHAMATIQERRDSSGKTSYRVQVRIKGSPPQSASFPKLTEARKWAQRTEADIRTGRYFPANEARRHTLGEAVDRYIEQVLPKKRPATRPNQTTQLTWWKERLGDYVLAEVTPARIAEQRDALLASPKKSGKQRSNSTAVRYLAVLSHLFTIAVKEWGWTEDNPVTRVSKPREAQGRCRFLSDDERLRLLAACEKSRNPHLTDAVMLALCSGMRYSEILNLSWKTVNFERRSITLEDTKNHDRRVVPLAGPALERLKEKARIRRMDTDLVFPAPRKPGAPARPLDIRAAFELAVARAKIENFKFHDLRHSCASYLAMNGATTAELADVLGHKTLQMVKRYSHFSEGHRQAIVDKMTAAVFQTPVADAEDTA
jgi:integrase